jgi:type I restriction enzyme, R subunit
MPNFISEDQIERATIAVFVDNLGYRHLNCIDNDTTGRSNEKDVLIKLLLKHQLKKLNPGWPSSAIEEAFSKICQTRMDKSDFTANREI